MKRAPIFEDRPREDPCPSRFRETTFEFLDRVKGDFWDAPRSMMQSWLDKVEDDAAYGEIRERLRSHDDDQFDSAYLELYIHELLRLAGFHVTIHPEIPGRRTHPDFLAERDGHRLYVEATRPGRSQGDKGQAGRVATFLDTLNGVKTNQFTLWISRLVAGPSPAAGASLRSRLTHWLSTLDPTQVSARNAPEFRWSDSGWEAIVRAIPAPNQGCATNPNTGAIGVLGHRGVALIDDTSMIKKTLEKKANKYGNLDAPYLIALGTNIFDPDLFDAKKAIAGSVVQELISDGDVLTLGNLRLQNDGYFGSPPNWQHRPTTGVLLINRLSPYSFQLAENTLWLHPSPQHPLFCDLEIPAEVVSVHGADVQIAPTCADGSSFFGIPEDWPPGDQWAAARIK